jgi:hypothetical protein
MTGSRSRAPATGRGSRIESASTWPTRPPGSPPTANRRPDERPILRALRLGETCVVTILLALWAALLVNGLVFAHSVAPLLPNKGR